MFKEGPIDIVDADLLLLLSELEEGVVAYVGVDVVFDVAGHHLHVGQLGFVGVLAFKEEVELHVGYCRSDLTTPDQVVF